MRNRVLAIVLALLAAASSSSGQDQRKAGTITSSTCPGSGCVQLELAGAGSGAITIGGGATASYVFEARVTVSPATAIWFTLPAFVPGTSAIVTQPVSADGSWLFGASGYTAIRVRASAFTSGTGTVAISVSPASQVQTVIAGSGGGGGGGLTNTELRASPVPVTLPTADTSTTATFVNSSTNLDVPTAGKATAIVRLTGTWTGFLLVKVSADGGSTYSPVRAAPLVAVNMAQATSTIDGTDDADSVWTVPVAGFTHLRIGGNTGGWTGSASVRVVTTSTPNGPAAVAIEARSSGIAANVTGNGSGLGSLHVTLTNSTDTANVVDGSGNLNVLAGQGSPNASIANAWWMKLGDGTTGPVTVLPASTFVAATDKALVVQMRDSINVNLNGRLLEGVTTGGLAMFNGPLMARARSTLSNEVLAAQAVGVNATLKGELFVKQTDNVNVTGPIGTTLALNSVQTNGTQQTKITDGTNVAAVKAASTAAIATDPALVVALSPNSPLPAYASTPTFNLGTLNGAALDATLTGGTAKAIARGGAKGATAAADLTGTAEGADHQALDVQLYTGGAAIDPRAVRALTSADVVTVNAGTNTSTAALALAATQTDRTQKTQLTDGTRDGTIKAASTAAAAADTALVVGLSPNSPTPAGTNVIGALSANQSVNQTQVNGVAVAVGQGIADTGTQRVVQAQEVTYSAGTTLMTATTAGTGPWFSICGSATKTIRVQRVRISGTVATGAKYGDVVLKKTSTATTVGTATTLTQTPYDSNSAAGTATNVKFYTVLGTAGGSVGVVGTGIVFLPITATPALLNPPLDFAWRDTDSEAPTLRGIAQCIEGSFGTTPATAPTLTVFVAWTEK